MEDRISQLPDDILISIISLIPTKQALSTSFLSKRWRNLFRFVSDVSIDLSCNKGFVPLACSDPPAFFRGLHGFLQRHSSCIHSFDLRCSLSRSSAPTLEQCILSLGDLGIQKLMIRQRKCCYILFQFSSHLLSLMPSLQYLKLSYVTLLPSLKNPCFSLKTIWLHSVIACQDSLECILSNCLSLCTLTLEWCSLPCTICFKGGPDLQLKSLSLLDCADLEEIRFYTPNLTKFDLESRRYDYKEWPDPVNLIFDYAPQLQSVHLISDEDDVPYFCDKLEKNVPSLDTLHLDAIGDLYMDGSIAMGANMFINLKRLELGVCDDKYNMFSLIRVLNGCPRLEEFQLATWVKSFEWPQEEENQVKLLHSQLKVVDMSGFGGSENEFAFISYIFKTTVELQQMIISWYIYMNNCVPGGNRETSYLPPSRGHYKKEKAYFCPPLPRGREWEQVCDCIHQMKHEVAVSNTLQLVTQKFPKKH